jgi:uncharacterized protein (DUF1330 family)
MPVYMIAEVRNPTDQAKLDEYRSGNTEVVARHGGRFLVRGGDVEVIEGDWEPQRIVVMEFPDGAAARAWYEDPDYQRLKALRQSASDTDLIVVEGAG